MAKASSSPRTKSAQQWAWEFLRRNPDYRDAFQKLASLSPEQMSHLGSAFSPESERENDQAVLRSLDLHFFDTSRLIGFKKSQKTVGEYFDQSKELRDKYNEPDVSLYLAEKFSLETYSLVSWFDPADEAIAEVAASMWHYAMPIQLGLERMVGLEHISFEDQKFSGEGMYPFPPTPHTQVVDRKLDKRRRRSPLPSPHMLPIVKGVDGHVFLEPIDTSLRINQTQVGLAIDLRFPIEFQLNFARGILEQQQEMLARGGFVQRLLKHPDRFGVFAEYLKILDRLDSGFSYLDIATEIDGLVKDGKWKHDSVSNKLKFIKTMASPRKPPNTSINMLTQGVRKKIERATHLRDYGYRALAFNA